MIDSAMDAELRAITGRALARSYLDEFAAGARTVHERGVGARGPYRQRAGMPVTDAKDAPGVAPSHRKLAAKNRSRKGREWQLLARDYFLSLGYHVEVAHGKIAWIPDKVTGRRRPITLAHDYFGCWDLAVVNATERFFVQVCGLSDTSTRRAKILDSGFPCRTEDLIFGHERGRTFRVLRGPLFELTKETAAVPK